MAGLMMAVNCAAGPCVQVYTDPTTHQLVITANQHRPGTTLHPHPTPTHTYKPRPKPRLKPRPAPYVVPHPKPRVWIPYKAVPVVHHVYTAPVRKKKSVLRKSQPQRSRSLTKLHDYCPEVICYINLVMMF